MSQIETAIAADLLERVEKDLGYHPPIKQVELVCDCAADDGGDGCTCDTIAAFIYWGDGDEEYAGLNFDRPEMAFDSDAVEAEMCRIDTQALADRIMRAVKRAEK